MAYSSAQELLSRWSSEDLTGSKLAQISPPFELDVIRYFGGKDLNGYGLLSGWAAPEPEHNWNEGCETTLQTIIQDPGGPGTIEIRGEPFINDKCPRQDIILHLNGFRIGYWRLTKASPCTLTARFEREQLFLRSGGMLMKLIWSFPDSVSPIARDLSNDTRELAFCFRSILVSKAEME